VQYEDEFEDYDDDDFEEEDEDAAAAAGAPSKPPRASVADIMNYEDDVMRAIRLENEKATAEKAKTAGMSQHRSPCHRHKLPLPPPSPPPPSPPPPPPPSSPRLSSTLPTSSSSSSSSSSSGIDSTSTALILNEPSTGSLTYTQDTPHIP
jgi:hypothetical protein